MYEFGKSQSKEFTVRESVHAACEESQAVDVIYLPHIRRIVKLVAFPRQEDSYTCGLCDPSD